MGPPGSRHPNDAWDAPSRLGGPDRAAAAFHSLLLLGESTVQSPLAPAACGLQPCCLTLLGETHAGVKRRGCRPKT